MSNSDFGPDGTQAPPPPRLFPDPLAGLVTADTPFTPQWTGGYSTSRVAVPTPPPPVEDVREAIRAQMERERRRSRGRGGQASGQQGLQPVTQSQQMPVGQQELPAKPANGVAALIGCLIVIGFFVLVLINIFASIFSG